MAQPYLSSLIWSTTDLLRGNYKQSEYGKVILPITLLMRLKCMLEPIKDAMFEEYEMHKELGIPLEKILVRKSRHNFFNISKLVSSVTRCPSTTISTSATTPITRGDR